jgi:hypothetical protein
MIRRRRAPREIPFSFDSFLDVVANVVGIIIRLILVAWVGARSYKAIVVTSPRALPDLPALTALPEPTDPRLDEIARRRRDLSQREREQVRRCAEQEQALLSDLALIRLQIERLRGREIDLEQEKSLLKARAEKGGQAARAVLLSVADLQKRSAQLMSELEKLRKQKPAFKQLRYHTPVSAVVQTEEVMFECRAGRVTLLDTAALLDRVRRGVRRLEDQLRARWEASDTTEAVGAFRLHYTVERERSMLDGPAGLGAPAGGGYRYYLSWEAEPVLTRRGERAAEALASGSAFRKVIDELDARQTVVTLWVYPDSFPLYRALRDFLHTREVVVAGRPLPEGAWIASSRRGTASRGQ